MHEYVTQNHEQPSTCIPHPRVTLVARGAWIGAVRPMEQLPLLLPHRCYQGHRRSAYAKPALC
jgi:hypothetical protein